MAPLRFLSISGRKEGKKYKKWGREGKGAEVQQNIKKDSDPKELEKQSVVRFFLG